MGVHPFAWVAEANLFPKPIVSVALLVLITAVQASGQTSPSLGDLARQVRSEKGTTQPKKVITNENLSADPIAGDFRVGESNDPKAGLTPAPKAPSAPSMDQAKSALDKMDILLNQVDLLDRATLVKYALANKEVNFPGREAWEQRLLASRQTYVTHGRELTQKGRQMMESAQALEASHATADDPRVQNLNSNLKQFVQDCVRTGAAFQAVVLEGRDLASQAPTH